jgi:hypothetical protein
VVSLPVVSLPVVSLSNHRTIELLAASRDASVAVRYAIEPLAAFSSPSLRAHLPTFA